MASEKKATQNTCVEEQDPQKTQFMKPHSSCSSRIEGVLHRRLEEKHFQMSRNAGDKSLEFFCQTFDELEKENEEHQNNESENCTVINIEESATDPLIPGEIIQSRRQQSHVFVPSLSAVPQERLTQANLKLRYVEDEGLYVQDRPQVPWWIINKMSNRLIEQDKGERWFDQSGCLNSLPDPVQGSCCLKAKHPPAGHCPGLSTVYTEPSTMAPNTPSQCDAAMWQLDLNLAGLTFTHPPLFGREHVLAQNLFERCEVHQSNRPTPDATTALQKEICDTGRNSAELATVYLPIPDRNVLPGGTSLLETNDKQPSHRLTSGSLIYGLSWAVDDSGIPMAPKTMKVNLTNSHACGVLNSQTNEKLPGRLKGINYDPNHPANTAIQGLLREACERRGEGEMGCFRLHACEEESDLTAEGDLNGSRRFALLKARSCRTAPPKAVPLHDREIKDSAFAEGSAASRSSSLFLEEEDEDPITSHKLRSIKLIEKTIDLAKRRICDVRRKYKLSDIVHEHQEADAATESSWGIFRAPRPLNPSRTKPTERVPSSELSDGCLKVRLTVSGARGLPVRQKTPREVVCDRRVFCCWQPATHNMATFLPEVEAPQAHVQPFFEVRFQGLTYKSRVKQGPNPHWKEDFTFDFKAKGGDYSLEGLSNAENDIVINIFDDISFQPAESRVLRGCAAQVFSGRQWLGSVTIPFQTLLQQSTVCESLPISQPPFLLGYTWSEEGIFNGQAVRTEESSLEVFITLDPPVSKATDLTARDEDQISQWLFPSDEEEGLLKQACEFERQCRAASGGRRRVRATVFNSDGSLVLASRFFGPLPPPEEVLRDPSPSSETALDVLATFVSLIPTVPSPSDDGNCRDVWFSSEQCLELAVGNHISLAVLLCNLFHYQQAEAWLLLGRSVLEGETTWILTKESDTYLVWNPRDGKHYGKCDTRCPLQTVDGLVNGHNVWFNVQRSALTSVVNFNLSDTGSWKALFPRGFRAATSGLPFQVNYRPVEMELVHDLQRRVEARLKSTIMEWRLPRTTRWDRHCPAMLREVLEHLDRAQSSDGVPTVAEKVLETMTHYEVTGFPLRMPYRDMDTVVDTVYNTGIHSTEIPETSFALAVHIHPYPNHILSMWVFLARLVRQQHGGC